MINPAYAETLCRDTAPGSFKQLYWYHDNFDPSANLYRDRAIIQENLYQDGKNCAMLRSLRPQKNTDNSRMNSATRPPVDSATFTNAHRRAVSIQARCTPTEIIFMKNDNSIAQLGKARNANIQEIYLLD